MIKEHGFTETIRLILKSHFGEQEDAVFSQSALIRYLNIKTKSANSGAKSRGSFGNLYAMYVLTEDYINNLYLEPENDYNLYEGAKYSDLFVRQRALPFGDKLQNHALNQRLNKEFSKYFNDLNLEPIIRDVKSQRYWINENLLVVNINGLEFNVAPVIIDIVDAYIVAKKGRFEAYIASFEKLVELKASDDEAFDTILSFLSPDGDARVFEIISFAILKYNYEDIKVFWGYSRDVLNEESLTLFKTGRTNANDGGIDFVMRPLGRFFQVTETTDFSKYFLDIDKVQRFPVSFVVKSDKEIAALTSLAKAHAKKKFGVDVIVDEYMSCIEELINLPKLKTYLDTCLKKGQLGKIVEEIVLQSKVEFHIN